MGICAWLALVTAVEASEGGLYSGVDPKILSGQGARPRSEFPPSDLSLTDLGQARYSDFQSFIAILEHRYGVDAELIMGIWGIESRFGLNVGTRAIGPSLREFAAQNPSKRTFSQNQLRSATRLVRRNIVNHRDLVGSYAGALGQTQFLPTSYENFAVDGDGDGDIDLWSAKDALASTANYMRQHGWQLGQVWGVAVNVPKGFYERSENRMRRKVEDFERLGVTPKYADEFPHQGFARVERYLGGDYLLFDNFYHILKYNNSRDYAFKVAALGDQVLHPDRAGVQDTGAIFNSGANLRAIDAPSQKKGPCKSKVCGVQIRLKKLGYYHGEIDGSYGPQTRNALGRFIRDNPGKGQDLLR